jgi:hypothetical protein
MILTTLWVISGMTFIRNATARQALVARLGSAPQPPKSHRSTLVASSGRAIAYRSQAKSEFGKRSRTNNAERSTHVRISGSPLETIARRAGGKSARFPSSWATLRRVWPSS